VLNAENSRILTQVGPGTPMGKLMRCYWQPVAATAQLADQPILPLRVLGEDLALYRGDDGEYGLIQRQCPHRGADLAGGWVEGSALRCAYHGWLFDRAGACVEQPFEDLFAAERPFRDRIPVRTYPATSFAGLIWAYLGAQPAPLIPVFEPLTWQRGFVEIILSELPCNWLQCHENSVDPVHFEWLHSNYIARELDPGRPRLGLRHLRIDMQEFEYGIAVGRTTEVYGELPPCPVAPSNRLADSGILCLWPNAFYADGNLEWRLPVDDVTTLSIVRQYSPIPTDMPAARQDHIPYWYGPVRDPGTGAWIKTHTLNQDFAAWAGQGQVADRQSEHLGRSDAGIVMLRRRLLADIQRAERGEDPAGIVRDPAANTCITLPVYRRERYVRGLDRDMVEKQRDRIGRRRLGSGSYYALQAGQPEAVQRCWEQAMGIEPGTR
jgi:5,5'-dehydrodivanillate O-demethylase oxygenase subunit